MKIAVLVKQIPAPVQLRMEGGRVVRTGVDLEVNAYCRRANAKAVELAGSNGEVVVFTMGPPSAEDALREMIASGATRGIHICDNAFAGSDTLATAVVLAAALRRFGPFDLVLAGLNSLDADTGQVPAAVAELMGLPFASGVRNLDISVPTLITQRASNHSTDSSPLGDAHSSGDFSDGGDANDGDARCGKDSDDGGDVSESGDSNTIDDIFDSGDSRNGGDACGDGNTCSAHGRAFTARLETDEGFITVTGNLPVVLSTAERLCYPSKAPPDQRQAVAAELIMRLTASDLGLPADQIGVAGSPTSVGPVRAVVGPERDPVMAASVSEAVDKLVELGAFEARSGKEVPSIKDEAPVAKSEARSDTNEAPSAKSEDRFAKDEMLKLGASIRGETSAGPEIWCFFSAADIGVELLGEAAELAHQVSGSVTGITTEAGLEAFARLESNSTSSNLRSISNNENGLISTKPSTSCSVDASSDMSVGTSSGMAEGRVDASSDMDVGASSGLAEGSVGRSAALEALSAVGADRVMLIPAARYDDGSVSVGEPAEVAEALAKAAAAELPWALLVEGTRTGRVVAAMVAARNRWGLTGDAIRTEVGADHRLVAWKPAFGGQAEAPIRSRSAVQMATIRPGVLVRRPLRTPAPPINLQRLAAGAPARLRTVSSERDDDDVGLLRRAVAVVALGQGVEPDGYPVISQLCAALGGAALGATRKVTDKAWMPRNRQIGVTGHAVAPRLLVAVGSSGRFNHTVGIRNAEVMLAVNNNPDAEIFDQVDVGLVGPWQQIVPKITEELIARGLTVT